MEDWQNLLFLLFSPVQRSPCGEQKKEEEKAREKELNDSIQDCCPSAKSASWNAILFLYCESCF